MRWLAGYLALCCALAGVLARDVAPVLPRLLRAALAWPSRAVAGTALAYVAVLAAAGAALPGRAVPGAPLRPPRGGGPARRLVYKCNGLLLTAAVVGAWGGAVWAGWLEGRWVADNYAGLFATANLFALTLSVYLFVVGRARRERDWLEERGAVEDFVMGAELNPFVCGVDVKFFSYRPAMAGWLLINLSFLAKQHDDLGAVTGRMALYQALTGWYICDYFVNEDKMVHTWDIIAERFGFMLVWGDYVFIPFGFSVQLFFLLGDARPLGAAEAAAIVCVFAAGVAVFRGANSQKHAFKTDPVAPIWGAPPRTVGGGRLLVSGFWGVARHMNYTGDLLLAASYCLPCGFTGGSLPYLYLIYLLLLTVHREKRDDERCAAKYKAAWDEYCARVPYRMVPFVY